MSHCATSHFPEPHASPPQQSSSFPQTPPELLQLLRLRQYPTPDSLLTTHVASAPLQHCAAPGNGPHASPSALQEFAGWQAKLRMAPDQSVPAGLQARPGQQLLLLLLPGLHGRLLEAQVDASCVLTGPRACGCRWFKKGGRQGGSRAARSRLSAEQV
jgi:hypothetical protein